MVITVHHLENSRSQRVLWMLEELGLPYEVRRYERDRKTMLAPPALKRIHPLGKAPVIDVDGEIVAETGAILTYLVDLAGGRLGPPGDRAGVLRYRHFIHYAEASLMPPLFAMLVVSRLGLLGKPAMPTLKRMLAVHLDWVEDELGTRPWFAGQELSAADVMMSFPLEAARDRADATRGRPRIAEWLDRIHQRPAYQRALTRGGPYRFA